MNGGNKMAGENKLLAEKLLKELGGAGNIADFTNCMTRLRVEVYDDSLVNTEAIKKTDGVIGLVEEETFQIILGPGKVNKVTDEFGRLAGDINLKDRASANKAEINRKNATP